MLKEFLKENQPVVYQALKNACENNRISSAYLFTGPSDTPKYEAAILLAESIFCENSDGLACESCSTCGRVLDGSYADMMILDGRDKGISKEMVDDLQIRFSKTALEKNGQRVYIIRNCENASVSAQNSMLKFLEEPGKGVTAILTTDNQSRILPTIISRCTILPFLPSSPESYYKAVIQDGIPAEKAYFLSHTGNDLNTIKELADTKEYENALMMLKQFLNVDSLLRKEFLIDYEISWRSRSTDREKAKKSDLLLLELFFDFLNLWLHDVIRKEDNGPAWYHDTVVQAPFDEKMCAEMIIIVNEERDKVNKYNDTNLLIDQAFFRLEDYIHDNGL